MNKKNWFAIALLLSTPFSVFAQDAAAPVVAIEATVAAEAAPEPAAVADDAVSPVEVAVEEPVAEDPYKALHDSFQLQIDGLTRQLKAAEGRELTLNERIETLEAATFYRRFRVALVGQTTADGFVPGVEGNLEFLRFAAYTKGIEAQLAPRIHFGSRVEWMPFALGSIVYFDKAHAFSAQDLKRVWDLSARTGFAVRVWKGVTVGLYAALYMPNPVDGAKETVTALKDAGNNVTNDITNLQNAGNNVTDAIGGQDVHGAVNGAINGSTVGSVGSLSTAGADAQANLDAATKKAGDHYTDALQDFGIGVTVGWTFQ